MEKKYVLLTLFVFVFLLTNIFDGVGFCLRVIPNAPWQHGFGIDTPAGSGRHLETPSTNVIKVTNLNDSGPGSLRDAIENEPSPKVIIFEVSGTIELQSKITIGGFTGNDAETKGSYITIAGQTAPSPGITIKGAPFIIERKCHDILIQHIRFRPGEDLHGLKGDFQDGLTTYWSYFPEASPPVYPTSDLVVDHCSFSWAVDENIDSGARNTTFMNCIIGEGLYDSTHLSKARHSKGLLILAYSEGVDGSGAQNVAIINNLFTHNYDRNPAIFGGRVVVANNYIYDCAGGIGVCDDIPSNGPVTVSISANYIVETDKTRTSVSLYLGVDQDGKPLSSKVYLGDDNYYSGRIQTDPWNSEATTSLEQRGNSSGTSTDVPLINRVSTKENAIWPTGYSVMPATEVKDYVLLCAGARPVDRDAVDTRLIDFAGIASATGIDYYDTVEFTNSDCTALITGAEYPTWCCTGPGTGTCNQVPEGGWPNLAKNTRTLTVPSNPNEVQASGYTKLEEWLHDFSSTVEGGKPGRPGTFTY